VVDYQKAAVQLEECGMEMWACIKAVPFVKLYDASIDVTSAMKYITIQPPFWAIF
jgi:hypothetical protein